MLFVLKKIWLAYSVAFILTNFVKTESASSSVHSNIGFQRRRTPKILVMVVHNHRAVWTEEEKKVNYEFGMMYCAVHGFEKFKKMGKNYLFISLFKRVLYFLIWRFLFFQKTFISYFYFFFITRKLVHNWNAVWRGGSTPIKS